MTNEAGTIDNCNAAFPADTQVVLQRVREIVHAVIPNAEEAISYDMPTFLVDDQRVVYFAGWKNRLAFYAVHQAIPQLQTTQRTDDAKLTIASVIASRVPTGKRRG